jgi:hypothetical protein
MASYMFAGSRGVNCRGTDGIAPRRPRETVHASDRTLDFVSLMKGLGSSVRKLIQSPTKPIQPAFFSASA